MKKEVFLEVEDFHGIVLQIIFAKYAMGIEFSEQHQRTFSLARTNNFKS